MQAGDDLSPADRFWYLEIALGAGRPDANNGVGEKGYGGPPEPETVRAAREEAGLTQAEAAQLVHATLNAWQKWESGDRKMQAATWELFQIKTGQLDSGA
ncbi:helix-turn-helix domain-containing protein [Acetobacter estunensis]|uniref:Helix-turn-helix domain-containing protein n=2 Tax=Acetobacter estunensis TaxID=104097 RepID=A0A967B8U6_9PROT|nr:helix-turn-helix domain-containing protein [Acetobacter estunensis]